MIIKINGMQYVELRAERPQPVDRLHSIAIYTDNADQMRDYLVLRGVTVPSKAGKDLLGNKSFSMQDPDGHTIEIVEYQRDGETAGQDVPDARISTHLTHAGIIVGSLSRAMSFYRDVLGFEETWRGGAGPTLSWVNLRVPEGTDYIEFMLSATPPAPNQRGGQHHVCLAVPDMQTAVRELESRPARKLYARSIEPKAGVNRKRQANLFDPDGTRVELMEPGTVDGKPTPPSVAPPPIP